VSAGLLLGLIVLSMGWLFFLLGAAMNLQALRKRRRAIPVLPGVVGSIAAFFTVAAVQAPWPWLWIALPLFLDVDCAPRLLLVLLRRKK
jgi:hypothetical protein